MLVGLQNGVKPFLTLPGFSIVNPTQKIMERGIALFIIH